MLQTITNSPAAVSSYKPVKNLLSKGSTNAKTSKNELETFILYLAPADTIISHNVCPFASPGCIKGCLNTAGRGAFSNVQSARINKTKFWAYDRKNFYVQLCDELLAIYGKITDPVMGHFGKVAIRLNGTSDIDHLGLLLRYTGIDFLSDEFSNLLFYDYTKSIKQIEKYKNTSYKLTFSLSEINHSEAIKVLLDGGNVAAVFHKILPTNYKGFEVIDGDKTDLRYFDPSGIIVGLIAKGRAKKDKTGFVINN